MWKQLKKFKDRIGLFFTNKTDAKSALMLATRKLVEYFQNYNNIAQNFLQGSRYSWIFNALENVLGGPGILDTN